MTKGINGPDGFKVVESSKNIHNIGKNVVEENTVKKCDSDGNSIWLHEFKTTDSEGNITEHSIYEDNFSKNGNPTTKSITKYDSSGNVKYSQKTSYQDIDGDGLSDVEVTEVDNNGDGKIDNRTTVKHNRNDNENTTIIEYDNNVDGIADSRIIESRYAGEHFISEERKEDYDADGKYDYVSNTKNYYDDKGDLVRSSIIMDKNGDGRVDAFRYDDYEKQEDGSEKHVIKLDSDGDGTIDQISVSYEKNGQIFYKDE